MVFSTQANSSSPAMRSTWRGMCAMHVPCMHAFRVVTVASCTTACYS